MTRFLFIGERPSPTALAKNYKWEDGRLAAKQLFDALLACNIIPQQQMFRNWYTDRLDQWEVDQSTVKIARLFAQTGSYTIVALGMRVATELHHEGLPHLKLVHPAARGKIRRKHVYQQHVRRVLGAST